jgi:hypothetical protein
MGWGCSNVLEGGAAGLFLSSKGGMAGINGVGVWQDFHLVVLHHDNVLLLHLPPLPVLSSRVISSLASPNSYSSVSILTTPSIV